MVNILYIPKRRLVNPAGIQVGLTVDLSAFDRGLDTKKSESKSIGGVVQSTLHYFTDTYTVKTTPILPIDRPQFDEFIYSTMNNEPFEMNNIDLDDELEFMNVTRTGTHSRSRVTNASVDYFNYSFNVREII